MDNRKYEIVLSELAEVIERKNTEIFLLKYDIDQLKAKLEAAEKSAEVKNEDNERK